MPFTDPIPPLPAENVPAVDIATGKLTPEWRQWLVKLLVWLKNAASAIP